MRVEYGGGAPPRVLVHSRATVMNLGSDRKAQMECRLIDQTEQGYYVQPVISQSVYFVPRDSIATIQFLP